MPNKRRWSELSERTRRWIVAGAVFEGLLKLVALSDLARRPASEVRGSKAVWATALVLVSSAGALPVAYLFRGRKPAIR